VLLSFQEDAIGIRPRDVVGVDNMTIRTASRRFPNRGKSWPGVPDDEQAKIVGGNTARVYNFDAAKLTTVAIATTR
jgi:hypothetical protein